MADEDPPEWAESISKRLAPWATSGGIDPELWNRTMEVARGRQVMVIGIGIYEGRAYNLWRSDDPGYPCLVREHAKAVIRLLRRFPDDIPDLEMVISAQDTVDPDPEHGTTPLPVMRYCNHPDGASNILITGDYWYARDSWDQRMGPCVNVSESQVPWEGREDKLGCNCGPHVRARFPGTRVPGLGGEDALEAKCPGSPAAEEKCVSVREYYRHHVAPLHPDLMVEGTLPHKLEDWSKYKYVLHLDGVGCSTRLPSYLGLGFATFVEQSGYQQHFQE